MMTLSQRICPIKFEKHPKCCRFQWKKTFNEEKRFLKIFWSHNTQHKGVRYKDTQHSNKKIRDTEDSHLVTILSIKYRYAESIIFLCWVSHFLTLMSHFLILMLSVANSYSYAECRKLLFLCWVSYFRTPMSHFLILMLSVANSHSYAECIIFLF